MLDIGVRIKEVQPDTTAVVWTTVAQALSPDDPAANPQGGKKLFSGPDRAEEAEAFFLQKAQELLAERRAAAP